MCLSFKVQSHKTECGTFGRRNEEISRKGTRACHLHMRINSCLRAIGFKRSRKSQPESEKKNGNLSVYYFVCGSYFRERKEAKDAF